MFTLNKLPKATKTDHSLYKILFYTHYLFIDLKSTRNFERGKLYSNIDNLNSGHNGGRWYN